jgi:putative Ca2+/H+ antiporter (TMEM165/GDT1 family)
LETVLVSVLLVALAEVGDKTQLLAFVLAARFRAPWPIVGGIFVATVCNHTLAGLLGAWIASLLAPEVLRWILGGSFIAMAAWTLVPDEIDGDEPGAGRRFGVFGTTLIAFFLVEMGDKTQVATAALAAHYAAPLTVVAGTTAGMLIADLPAVFAGDRLAPRIPLRLVRAVAALIFAGLGVAAIAGAGSGVGL